MTTNTNAWEPYRPTPESPWDLSTVAHLHRRAGFAANWKVLQRDLLEGPDAAIDRVLKPPPQSDDMRAILDGLRIGVRNGPDKQERLEAYWFYRLVFDPFVLREKMTLFWHDHFATSNRKVRNESAMLDQNELLRRHALDTFPALLQVIVQDPAMLVWLDAANNSKRAPNENLARELLELFMLGEGHYTESDVRAVARALTGIVQDASNYGMIKIRYDESEFDSGDKTFLGGTGPWKPDDILRIGLQSDHAAEFISRKLYRFLVGEADPPADIMAALANSLRSSGYSISQLVATILRSNQFFAAVNRRQKVASPVDLTVGFLRSLDSDQSDVDLLPLSETCARQGQHLFNPPNVGGWPGGKAWINSGSIIERTLWLTHKIWGNERSENPTQPIDLLAWAERNEIEPASAGQALLDLTLQNDLPADSRELVLAAARSADAVGLRKALQLIVYCPAYQLI